MFTNKRGTSTRSLGGGASRPGLGHRSRPPLRPATSDEPTLRLPKPGTRSSPSSPRGPRLSRSYSERPKSSNGLRRTASGGGGGNNRGRDHSTLVSPMRPQRSLSPTSPPSGSGPRRHHTPAVASSLWAPQNSVKARKTAFRPHSESSWAPHPTLGAGPAPMLHFLTDDEAKEVAGNPHRLLAEWLDSYGREDERFESTIIEAEVKLRRAEIFCKSQNLPSPVLTSVAFEVWDNVAGVFGRYSDLVRVLARIMKQSVFQDVDAVTDDPSGFVPSTTVQEYIDMKPYFTLWRELVVEKTHLLETIASMKKTMAAWEAARKAEIAGTKRTNRVMGTWSKVVTTQKHTREVKRLETTIEHQGETIEHLTDTQMTSVAKVLDMFLILDPAEQKATVWELIQNTQSGWEDILKRLLAVVPVSLSNRVAFNALTLKDSVSQADLVRFGVDLVRSVRVREKEGLQGNLLNEMLMAAGDIRPCLETCNRLLQGYERRVMMRLLVPVDDRVQSRDELRDHLRGIEMSPKAIDPKPGMFDPLLVSLTPRERTFLIADSVESLGEAAMPPVVGALLHGPLKDHAKSIPPDTRQALLELLLADAPEDMQCRLLKCKYHDHSAKRDENPSPAPSSGNLTPRRKARRSRARRLVSQLPLHLERRRRRPSTPRSRRRDSLLDSGSGIDSDADTDDFDLTSAASGSPRIAYPMSLSPWTRYMGPVPANMKGKRPKLELEGILNLVYDCYEKKVKATSDDEYLPEFMKSFLTHKFGLPSLSDAYCYAICDAVLRLHHRSRRLELFGRLVGVLDKDSYTPRRAELVMSLIHKLVPRFNKSTFRTLKEGQCVVKLADAMHSLPQVFVHYTLGESLERVYVPASRRDALLQRVSDDAVPFGVFLKRGSVVPRPPALPLHLGKLERSSSVTSVSSAPEPSFGGAGGGGGTSDSVKEEHLLSALPKMSSEEMVVDLDRVVEFALDTWTEQMVEDKAVVMDRFDMILSARRGEFKFEQFKAFLDDIVPSHTYNDQVLVAMFGELCVLPGTEGTDGITRDAVGVLCMKYGICPIRRD